MAKNNETYLMFECTCGDINIFEWNRLMKHKRRCSYRLLCKKIKRDYPEMYEQLNLDLYNPWKDMTYSTPTHYVLTHSAIEYFFRKVS